MRTIARETLFKIVFASQFNDTESGFRRALYKTDGLDGNDAEYCENILAIIAEHKREFIEILDKRSRLFPESGLFTADRSILLISLAEILYREDIPDSVSVNEAANIASKYSSVKSASYISGILAEVIKEKNDV